MKKYLGALAAVLMAGAAPSTMAKPVTAKPTADALPGYHIVDRIRIADGWWDYANVEPEKHNLYLTRGNGVLKIDLNTGLIDNRFIPGSEGRAVIPIPGTDMMLTTMAGYSVAILFDQTEGKVLKMIRVTQQSDSAVYEPVGKRVWVMGHAGEASAIDPVSMAVTDTIQLGGKLEFSATDGRGHVFVNGSDSASIIAFDAPSKMIMGKWEMKDCEDPSGMAYVDHADVILSVCFNNMMKVLDARTGKEIATVPVGKGSDAIIYDKATKRAFIPSAYDGVVTVVSVKSRDSIKVLEVDRTQIGTRTGAIDSKTGRLYLPTARFGPLNKFGWPEALPGTVELLVMEPNT